MRNEKTYTRSLICIAKRFVVILASLLAFGRYAIAQGLPEGTIGWWFYGPGSGNYAADPVTACQNSAVNHMGTWLVAMRPTIGFVGYDCKYPHFLVVGGVEWRAYTWLECAPGYFATWNGVCRKRFEPPLPLQCSASDPGYGEGNPIVLSTGDKVQIETDPIGPQQGPLQFTRTYRSLWMKKGSLGDGWSLVSDRTLETSSDTTGQPPTYVSGIGEQGSYFVFSYSNGTYTTASPTSGTLTALNAAYDEWVLKNNAGRMDHFKKVNGTYKLVSSHTKEGVGQYFSYDGNNHLQTITDSFGRVLQVVWKNEYVIDSILGTDLTVHYEYDLATRSGGGLVEGTERLVKVLVKDANGSIVSTKEYHYELPNRRFLLTGITDENGSRFATFAYDAYSNVVLSVHAGDADRRSIAYLDDTTRTVTDPLGSARTFSLTDVKGFGRLISINQPGGAGCGPGAASLTYDGQGNLSTSIDFNGNKTCYVFDPVRNLETGRIEGVEAAAACPSMASTSLSANQRKILTLWHPDARVTAKISSPKKRVSFIFNGQPDLDGQVLTCAPAAAQPDGKPISVVCKRIEQATNDDNGALGFNAAPIGRPRIWTFTYNSLGQILTSNGPVGESGNMELTTYSYYTDTTATHSKGDLSTVTNALGHVTEYLEYTPSGKVTRLRDPNGVITAFTYDARSRMTSSTLGANTGAARTTTYDYDSVGQLVKVTGADGAFVTYAYDGGHRLTDISDGLGNSVHYTLDNAGNRIREEVKDSGGNLSRQVIRLYDPLNRLQEVTGASR